MRKLFLILIVFSFLLVGLFSSTAADLYARRIFPVFSDVTSCSENQVFYQMVTHKLIVCKNTGPEEVGAGSGTGITSLNGLNAITQTFDVGTFGNDFNISSIGSIHTFNLPTSGSGIRGLLSSADWTNFNSKQLGLGLLTKSGSGTTAIGATFTSLTLNDCLKWNGSNWINSAACSGGGGSGTVTNVSTIIPFETSDLFTAPVTLSTTTPFITFNLSTHSGNMVYASGDCPFPCTGTPSFRALVDRDIPDQLTLTRILNLTTNGFIKTSSSNGSLTIDTNTYIASNANNVFTGTNDFNNTITAGLLNISGLTGSLVFNPRDGTGSIFTLFNPTGDDFQIDLSGVGTVFTINVNGLPRMEVAGSIRGLIEDKGGQVFNCKSYGAKGDGTTDDTTAINNCITAAAGNVAFFPAGTFVVNNLSTPTINTTIQGSGINITIIKRKTNSSGGNIIALTNAGILIEKITFDANCGTPTFPASVYTCSNQSSPGYDLTPNANDITLKDIEVKNSAIQGIRVLNAARTKILNPTLTGFNSATVGPAFGVQFDAGATDGLVDGGVIKNYKLNGVIVKGDSGATLTNTSYYGNHLQTTPSGGGQIAAGCNSPLDGNCYHRIINNRFYSVAGSTAASGIEINGSGIIANNYGDGLSVSPYFIAIQGGTHYSITGNMGKNYTQGLHGDESVSVTDYIVARDNDFSQNTTPVSIASSGTHNAYNIIETYGVVVNNSQLARTTALGGTTIYTTPAADGLYEIEQYLSVSTAATSGTISATFTWTDADSNTNKSVFTATPDIGTQTYVAVSSRPMRVKASTNIQISTVFNTVVGTPTYSFYTVIKKVQ